MRNVQDHYSVLVHKITGCKHIFHRINYILGVTGSSGTQKRGKFNEALANTSQGHWTVPLSINAIISHKFTCVGLRERRATGRSAQKHAVLYGNPNLMQVFETNDPTFVPEQTTLLHDEILKRKINFVGLKSILCRSYLYIHVTRGLWYSNCILFVSVLLIQSITFS